MHLGQLLKLDALQSCKDQYLYAVKISAYLLQGDAYTSNWLSAIRHTTKLARRMIHNGLGCRAIS